MDAFGDWWNTYGLMVGVLLLTIAVLVGISTLMKFSDSRDGVGSAMKKHIGKIEVRDVIVFFVGITVTVLTLWIGYIIVFGFNIGFDWSAPTYDEIFTVAGITSIFDKVIMFNYLQMMGMLEGIAMIDIGFIVGMLGQWIAICAILGFWIGLMALGHRFRVVIYTVLIMLLGQFIILFINPSMSWMYSASFITWTSIMILANVLFIFGFALLFNAIWSRTLWKSLREYETFENI